MGSPKTPESRDPSKDYAKGIEVYLKNLPRLLRTEQEARAKYDPRRIGHDIALERKYDPTRAEIRSDLGERISSDLDAGYSLPVDFQRELQQEIRGSQAARGNVLGNAPSTAESLFTGREAYNMYRNRLATAGTYLQTASPATPDRSAQYTAGGSTAGTSGQAFGQQAYQNQIAAAANQSNPWASALGGAASGAAMGASTGNVYAAAGGAIVGGAAGYFGASDERLKLDIKDTGEKTRDGIPIVTFRYLWSLERFRGVIAQVAEKIRPDAVCDIGGWKFVHYRPLGIRMTKVEG